jgi:uncharacterized protein YjbI with pentapeptide repeats
MKADLSHANLERADLHKANLEGSVLRDANLDFAAMKGVVRCNTVMPDGQRVFKDC